MLKKKPLSSEMNICFYPVVITEGEIFKIPRETFRICLCFSNLFIQLTFVLNSTSSLANGSNKISLLKKLYCVPEQLRYKK